MSKRCRETRLSSPESPRPNLPPRPASGTFSFEGLAAGFHEEQASSMTSMHSPPTVDHESAVSTRGFAVQDEEGSRATLSFERSAAAVHEAYLRTRMGPWASMDPAFTAFTHGIFAQDVEGFEETSSSDESASDSPEAQAGLPAPKHSSSTMDPDSAPLTSDISEQDVDASQKSKTGKQPMRGPIDTDKSDSENWDWDFSDQRQTKSNLDIWGTMRDDTEDEMSTSSLSRHENRLARRMAQSHAGQWPSFPESTDADRFNPTHEAIAGPSGSAAGARGQPWSTLLMDEFQLPSRGRTALGLGEAGPSNDARTDSSDSSDITDIRPARPGTECGCVACGDSADETDLIDLPCEHQYCQPCLLRHVEVALTDETCFPPQCCERNLPLSLLETHIGADLTKKYEEKVTERADTARTYCSNRACSSYILPSNVSGNVGSCSICDTKTCTACKQAAHEGECQPEEDDFLATATALGWKRCECGHLIERSFGCIHVTCRCGRELCYECGRKWGTCGCGWTGMAAAQVTRWDEGREEPFFFSFRPPSPQGFQWLQTRGVGCVHPRRWDRVEQGLLQCGLCFHLMPQFVLECPLCTLRACARCKRDLLPSFDL